MKEIYKKGFVMCKLPQTIQNAILEAHTLAAKNFKYSLNNINSKNKYIYVKLTNLQINLNRLQLRNLCNAN